ncbi:uncharacterized protein LOC121874049 [Homarus americanus]|nr:uncharacterized protein LOC121874049 [Homarus americanus]
MSIHWDNTHQSVMSTHSSGSSVGRGSGLTPHLVPVGMALTPKNLLKRYKLPTAAHLHTPTAPPGLDLSRPLLLYNTYNSTKVRGVSLRPGRDGAVTPVGPAIVIPESYTGWFAIVTSEGHTATYYTTVEQVATSKLSFFLTRYDVPAYTNTEDDEGRVSYQKTVVQSGHVLKLLGIFEDLNAKKTNSGGRGRDAMSVFNCDKFAQCLNYRNEVVFLPFSASGRFYTTAHKTSKNPNHVYLMAHILKNHKLPLTVRLVCGYMPRVPCSFTGVLRLEQSQKEAVILACTMTNEAQATLFEIDVSSNFVLTPVKDPVFPKTPIFLKTVSYCEDEADAWRRQIKVTHHVTEKRSRSLTRSLSDKFVEPLSSVRPLSLSFLSDHDKRKGRDRDHSRESRPSQTNKDKSKDKNKEHRFRDFRIRENSVEKTKFTYHDKSNSYNGYPLKDPSLENKKNADHRKISKQNTYVLQNGKSSKHVEKKAESESSFVTTRSIENMDYSRVIDDISPIPENEEEGESHYAEICDYAYRNQKIPTNNDAPLSLPNISLTQTEEKKKGKLFRKVSRDISSFTDISIRKSDPFKRALRRKSSSSPSETSSCKSSGKASDNSRLRDTSLTNGIDDVLQRDKVNNVYRDEVLKMDKLKEGFREESLKKGKVYELYREESLKKGKVNELYREESLKKGKVNEMYREESLKKGKVNKLYREELLHKGKVNEMYREESLQKGKVNELYREESLKKGKVNEMYREESLKKGKVNELYREELLHKGKVNEMYREESLQKGKVNELYREESLKKGKVNEMYREESLKKGKVNELYREESLKKGKVNELYREEVADKDQTNQAYGDEMLEKDKVNEVYIIRVVVKDREDDKMSTLAKDTTGGYYMKIRGFEVPKEELGSTVSGDEVNGYDSLC